MVDSRFSTLIGVGILILVGCDWGHSVQFQVRPSPADQIFAAALEAAARKAALTNFDRGPHGDCPLGAFLEANSPTPAQAIWLCAGRTADVSVADLREFNRGTPWRPDASFLSAQDAIASHLREQFGDRVDVLTGSDGRLTITPRATP
jgi:hypothetical protein